MHAGARAIAIMPLLLHKLSAAASISCSLSQHCSVLLQLVITDPAGHMVINWVPIAELRAS
jgi:hypothetical protein